MQTVSATLDGLEILQVVCKYLISHTGKQCKYIHILQFWPDYTGQNACCGITLPPKTVSFGGGCASYEH